MQTSEGLLCPVCRVTLAPASSQGVAMSCCPRCDGAWLDRAARETLAGNDPQSRQQREARIREQDQAMPAEPRPWRGALFDSD
jgi:Zn-finger nucleic acid-binding protein